MRVQTTSSLMRYWLKELGVVNKGFVEVDEELVKAQIRELLHHHAHENLSDDVVYARAVARVASMSDNKVHHKLDASGRRHAKTHTDITRIALLLFIAILLLLFLVVKSEAQSTQVRGATKGTTSASTATVTPIDPNHNGFDVNCVQGCGGGSGGTASNFGSTFPSQGTAIGAKLGANMSNLLLDINNNLMVNCAAGCAGGSSTPVDGFAIPSTAGLQMTFPMLFNGATYDRWRGDLTNGAFVNIKQAVTLTVQWSGQSVGITGTVDVSDRAARLLGVFYGSQGQQFKQTATNFNGAVELFTGATAYDGRQIRTLTNADVVKAQLQDNSGNGIDSILSTARWLNVNPIDTIAPGTTAPPQVGIIGGKSNDGTPQYQPVPLGPSGRSVITEPYNGLTTTTSYHASANFAASSTTDNSCIPGNATNTVLLRKITVSGIQTTSGILNTKILKRSAADTGGTSANMTRVPDDANYAAAVTVPVTFTGTGPTVGTPVGDIDNVYTNLLAAATATAADIYIFKPDKPIILRGTAQVVCLNLGGAVTGGTVSVTYDWTETTTP